MDQEIKHFQEVGTRSDNGNLLSVQAEMFVSDYCCENAYFSKLDGYLEAAKDLNYLNDKTIAVFPEYIGTWLVCVNDVEEMPAVTTYEDAMMELVKANREDMLGFVSADLGTVLGALSRTVSLEQAGWLKLKQVVLVPLFNVKAQQMAKIYHTTFSRLSQKYGITIVAGSIVLPDPQIVDTDLVISQGDLYNISVVYKPDGTPYQEVARKAHPTTEELPFTREGSISELPTFDTPAGKLGVLICADAWHGDCYKRLSEKGADLIAAPSYVAPAGCWESMWQGYSPPVAEDLQDIGLITEKDATLKYASGKIASSSVKFGIQTFLRGAMWDLDTDGQTIIVEGQKITPVEHVNGAALVNLWM